MPDVHDPDDSESATDADYAADAADTDVATVVYEDAHGDRSEVDVATEHLTYREDHWVLTLVVDGKQRVRRIPRERVYHVDRPPHETRAESARKSDTPREGGSDA